MRPGVAAIRKRQFRSGLALFLCLLAAACSGGEAPGADPGRGSPPVADSCRAAPDTLQRRAVTAVVDGDTLRLAGGDKLRLVGVNTREIGRDGRPDEPLARAARTALEEILGPDGAVWLRAAEDSRDRYDRLLAYAFDARGHSVAQQLIARGLGFHVAIAPNLALADCLRAAEHAARAQGLGVWADRPLAIAELPPEAGGFYLIRDRVTRVSFKDNGWWVQLGGKLGVKIGEDDQARFSRRQLQALEGATVEVRGWLVPMRGAWWMLNLDHPSMLQPQSVAGQ
ncbi:thermonuclease family protein [Seongchinamella sediminis]|uniref:Thermonuclease family protein n=1 Tax=Seongchinamella sediminis TaxID=2283635 RepID=A0A3L7E2Z7_9GAMM|nr:thermonuclease family protein [Seongchinamella sediminis]RLQ23489.1 thermonuclease family protein [Seongchinamella sediminis]